jgi:hypothetical protein
VTTYTRHPAHPQIFIGDNGLVFNTFSGVLTAGQSANEGYRRLICSGKRYLLHREVASLYVPNPQRKPYINHKNGTKSDNRAENLEWVTPKENVLHGLHVLGKWPKKSFESPSCKLTEVQVKQIKESSKSSSEMAKALGVSPSLVRAVRRGEVHP